MQNMFYVYNIIQESLRFWIPCCGFQLKDSGFLVSVTWLLDSLSSIPDSKAQDSQFNKKKILKFWIPWAKISRMLEFG